VLLFARVPVLGVAWLRVASAAVVFAVWRRPLTTLREPLVWVWGAVLAAMNCCFYEAIARLPLGTVAAVEFVPVIALAAYGARTLRNLSALAVAVGGVALLSDVQLGGSPVGFAFAGANAVLFALYIALAHRASRHSALDGLAAAMLVAAVLITPVAGPSVASALTDPVALLAGVGVGVSSSVIPYVTDQLAMARLSRAGYALMVSLLPATAVLIGVIVLGQVPSVTELSAVGLVIAGVAVHRDPDERASDQAAAGAAVSGAGAGAGGSVGAACDSA
jgi:inner membrane transporter RhtA